MTTIRPIDRIVTPTPTSDGAGVKLLRSVGSRSLDALDPFLMLDEFGSANPDDYIAGFPSHPHRGFETVTYMLAGAMRHEDSAGGVGELGAGDVQWMTAGRGVIHSEIPLIKEGLMRGFQLWINLPAAQKMIPPRYQNITADKIPVVRRDDGAVIKVIAGEAEGVVGPVTGIITDPLYLDVTLAANDVFRLAVPRDHTLLAYLFEGEATFGAEKKTVTASRLVTFGDGDEFVATSGAGGRFLLLAALPLREPVARYGPFVMSTNEQIEQAIDDYRRGRFALPSV